MKCTETRVLKLNQDRCTEKRVKKLKQYQVILKYKNLREPGSMLINYLHKKLISTKLAVTMKANSLNKHALL